MKEITSAIAAKQAKIKQLQSDIGALESAASILGGTKAKAPAARPTTATAKPKAKPKAKAKAKRKRQKMDAAARKAVSKRMKAYWAKRRKAKQ